MLLRVMTYLIVLALAVLILSPYKAQAATILTVVGCNPVADGQGGIDPNCTIKRYDMEDDYGLCKSVSESLNTNPKIRAKCERDA